MWLNCVFSLAFVKRRVLYNWPIVEQYGTGDGFIERGAAA